MSVPSGTSFPATSRATDRQLRMPVAAALTTVLLSVAVLSAQYGHPLQGTWSGDWGPSADIRHRVLLQLSWDGKAISGRINPGPNAVPLQSATLDPSTWSVRLEAEGTGPAGPIHYRIEGTLENIGSYHRTLSGVWMQGTERGDFRVERN
jgi:hypothetical protein